MRPVALAKKEPKKKKKKTVENWLFAQTTHVAVPKSKFACRVASGVYFYISNFIKISSVVRPLWAVEYRSSPLLWPLAYTTGCTTVQAVIPCIRRSLTGSVECKGYGKNDDFRLIPRCISETVIVRWAHAARQFVSIEFSFQPYNI